jgi:hypothetical protein
MLAETVEQDAHLLVDNEIAVASALYGKASSLRELGDQVNIEDVALWRTVVRMIDQGWVVSGTALERPRPSTTTHASRT